MQDKDYFEVKVTQRSQGRSGYMQNGKWIDLPENVSIAMKISGKDAEYIYPEINEVLSQYRTVGNIPDQEFEKFNLHVSRLNLQNNMDSNITFNNRIDKLHHKLEAIMYHMNNFNKYQSDVEKKYRTKYTNSRVEFEDLNPVFIYEIESFLFQVQSSLDILGQIIALVIRDHSFDSFIYSLIDKLKNSTFLTESLKDELSVVIKNSFVWYNDFNSMRNLITHWGNLINFSSLTHGSTLMEDTAKISYPKMPNGITVTNYMTTIWEKLKSLIRDIGNIVKKIQI
jgi:hypothetical protein